MAVRRCLELRFPFDKERTNGRAIPHIAGFMGWLSQGHGANPLSIGMDGLVSPTVDRYDGVMFSPKDPAMSVVTEQDLDRLYARPAEAIQRAVLPHLIPFHEAYLAVATFFCLASGRAEGLDASPRGGPAGFVKVIDPHHVVFADWPGNNRIETLRNLVADDRIAMLFLFPGLEVFLRINGRGSIATDDDLLDRLKEGGKRPKTAILVSIDQVLFHCGKAINRAGLWQAGARIERNVLPSVGQMKVALAGGSAADAEAVDDQYLRSVRNDLY
jgi:PPOX class probable FMN-dependent enzyme